MKIFFIKSFQFIVFIYFLFLSNELLSELINPNPKFLPKEVISIQLSALKNNNFPYKNAGIEQTWEFAHPLNKKYTGPLSNFKKMMYSSSYLIMLNHSYHKISYINSNEYMQIYFVEVIDEYGNNYGFKWIVEKIIVEGKYKNCWMTSNVSPPMIINNSV